MAVSLGLDVPEAGKSERPTWLEWFDRVLRAVEWVFETIALTALGLMMINTVANALMRHLYDDPIPGSLNATLLYMMPALVFLSLGRVQAMNAHIAATLFVDRMPEIGQRMAKIVVTVVILVVVVLMAQGSLGELQEIWGAKLGGSPELPLGPSWLFVPIGLAAIALRAFWQLLVLLVAPNDPGVKTAPEAPAEAGGVESA